VERSTDEGGNHLWWLSVFVSEALRAAAAGMAIIVMMLAVSVGAIPGSLIFGRRNPWGAWQSFAVATAHRLLSHQHIAGIFWLRNRQEVA